METFSVDSDFGRIFESSRIIDCFVRRFLYCFVDELADDHYALVSCYEERLHRT